MIWVTCCSQSLRRAAFVRAVCLICMGALPANLAAEPVAPVELGPPESAVDSRWAVGLGYGVQWYTDGDGDIGDAGTSTALQLGYQARLETERESRWQFELGYEYAESLATPEIAPGRERTIRSHGLYYRFSRFIGQRFYLGGRAGIARVRGPDDKSNLDVVVGLQTGLRLASWLGAGVEVVATEPSIDGAQPVDLRGVMTVSF